MTERLEAEDRLESLPPLPQIAIRWRGLLVLFAAIAVVAFVARVVSVRAGEGDG